MGLFSHSNEELAEKLMLDFEKGKILKFEKQLIKNGSNEKLFNLLLQNEIFVTNYLEYTIDFDIFQKLSIPVQKMIMEKKPKVMRLASDEIKNDRVYMEELQYNINSHKNDDDDVYLYSIYDYDCLGSKLANDKDFILSIKDKYPNTFTDALKNNMRFDDEIIKEFFKRHYGLLCELPNKYLKDYDYIVSIIDNMPSDYLDLCNYLGLECLRVEKIKQAIINKGGEECYYYALNRTLFHDPKLFSKFTFEEIKELIISEPYMFCNWIDVDAIQKILAFGKKNNGINLVQKIKSVSKLKYKNIDNPQKLTKVLYELSNGIGNKKSNDYILKQVTEYWEQINSWIVTVDDYPENHKYNSFYVIYNLLIGIENNKLDDIFKVFINKECMISKYASGIKNITVTEDNLYFLQLACNSYLFKSDEKTIEMYNKLFLKVCEWNNNPYDTMAFIDNLSHRDYMVDLLLNTDIDSIDQELLINIYNYVNLGLSRLFKINDLEELRDYQKIINKLIEVYPSENLLDLKSDILLKCFQIDLQEAMKIKKSYLNASEDSSLYRKIPEAKYLKQIFEKIIECGNEKELEVVTNLLEKQDIKILYKDVLEVIDKIKKEYGKEFNLVFLQVNENKNIIDASNMEFNMLVHVIGAYGSAPVGDIYDSWNTKERTSRVSICSSFISDNNMGIAPTNNSSVILGFSNLPDDYLELMSCQDIYSIGFEAARASNFLDPKELIDNTRQGHNELVIRRRKGKYTEEKIQPSYIVCFDIINDESKVAAKKFSIPIIFIDREKVAERHHNDIVSMMEQFKNTFDPSLISKIICEQENNRAGLRLTRSDLVEKYFSTEFRQHNIDEIYRLITIGLERKNENAIAAMAEFVKALEVEEEKIVATMESTYIKNTFDVDVEEYINILKGNPLYSENSELEPQLSPEESYKKFLECRNKLSEAEKLELQEINENVINMDESYGSMRVS